MNMKIGKLQSKLDNLIEIIGAIFSEACALKRIQIDMKKD